MKLKMTALALCAAMAAQGVAAGSLEEPIVEAPVVAADASSSSNGAALVLALALLMAVPLID